MSDLVREEFNDRQADIDTFCELARLIENGSIIISEDQSGDLQELVVTDQLKGILRSVIQLMSYNQAEATMRGCLEAVYDHLDDNDIGYNQLNLEFQKTVLKGTLKNYESGNNLQKKLKNKLSENLPRASFFIKKIFNGNVSKETIHEIEKNYQMNIKSPREARAGVDLNNLKDARNDLAHGNISFSKHGKMQSLSEIVDTSNRASLFLQGTISSFEDYIYNKNYLCSVKDD